MARKTDDQTRCDSWEATQRELRPGETVMARLGFLRWLQRVPWRHTGFTRNSSGDIVIGAFMPETCAQEDEWERKAIEMHEHQEVIELPDKPLERAGLRRGTGVAAFDVIQVDSSVPKFHERSPASTEVQRRTKRSPRDTLRGN